MRRAMMKAAGGFIIDDQFGGTGSMDGRTPDTTDNGNTWSNVYFTASVSGGRAVTVDSLALSVIDTGFDDVYIEATCRTNGSDTSSDNIILTRVNDVSGGFPTDHVLVIVDHTNSLFQVYERISGVNTLLDSVSVNPLEDVDILITVTTEGADIVCTMDDGVSSETLSAVLTATTGTNVGVGPRVNADIDYFKVAKI